MYHLASQMDGQTDRQYQANSPVRSAKMQEK